MSGILEIDGSQGEGGGQILRTALALSVITGRPFVIRAIRARRKRPGLMRQHLACVRAAREICGATVAGEQIGATELTFQPAPVIAGDYRFAVGSAGSTMLVLQTVLPPLLLADGTSRITLEGGTHNPLAPTFEFVDRSFLPVLRGMGASVSATLERRGFAPAGGGRVSVNIEGGAGLRPLDLRDCGKFIRRRAEILTAHVPPHVGRREAALVAEKLGWNSDEIALVACDDSAGPGNVISLELARERVTAIIAAFGTRGVSAELVAQDAINGMRAYQGSGAPVDLHLADQLLLPCALAGGGTFHAQAVTYHSLTNAAIIERFLPVKIVFDRHANPSADVRIEPAP